MGSPKHRCRSPTVGERNPPGTAHKVVKIAAFLLLSTGFGYALGVMDSSARALRSQAGFSLAQQAVLCGIRWNALRNSTSSTMCSGRPSAGGNSIFFCISEKKAPPYFAGNDRASQR